MPKSLVPAAPREMRREQSSFRRLPVGAEVQAVGGVHFRVWAPDWRQVDLILQPPMEQAPPWPEAKASSVQEAADEAGSRLVSMTAEASGYFSVYVREAVPGTRYRYRLGGGNSYPDPASRWQPEGVHGPSAVVDPGAYAWQDAAWKGIDLKGQVFYELHVGTFTAEGTYVAAARELPELADVGITAIELMPVNEFPGRFGWGYDGVDLFAPTRLYGPPDDLRRFVDHAHALGLAVVLDVVYNHFGPTGNYATTFAKAYHTEAHKTDWGAAMNFDDPRSGPVRDFFIANAGYWIDEFHFDGLRLDALHAIRDDSPEHVVTAIARRVRQAAGARKTVVIGENELQQTSLLGEDGHGEGLDAVWNDDFHHTCRVAATGHNEFYYADYQGSAQEIVSAVKWGYLYQGQWTTRQGRRRGEPACDVPAPRFVIFLQNHDQVANSAGGLRMQWLTSPGRYRALTALLLLAPSTPMLFQGQEFAASAPFLYFADHEVDLARLVREGRNEFLRQFQSLNSPESEACLPDPGDPRTFECSKIDPSERARHAAAHALHKDLLRLRREDPVFSAQRADRLFGAVIGAEAFLLRYFGDARDDRLMLVNLGRDLEWTPVVEPLAAPPRQREWTFCWSSEDPRYGGSGTGLLDTKKWRVPGHAAIVLRAEPIAEGRRDERDDPH